VLLPPDTSEPPQPQPDRRVYILDLLITEICKAELTLVLVDNQSANSQSPIQVVSNRLIPTGSQTHDHAIVNLTPFRYTAKLPWSS